MSAATAPKRSMLLDTPSLVYRAFFAVPASVKDPSGRPVNAVRGVMEMITRLLQDHRPDVLVAAFDADWRPASRVAAYPGYKAQRAEDPPELAPQFEMLTRVLDAFGIARAEVPGLEADDAIATLAHRVPDRERAMIVTGDRDMLALVRDPVVQLLFTVKGVSELAAFGEAEVREKYGVTPSAYTEFAMMRGDPSDGLPGVAGIGPVRAAKLLGEYGSIEKILAHTAKLPPKQAAAFEAAREYLAAMKRVVPMVLDANVVLTRSHPPDAARVAALAAELGLGGAAARLTAALTH